MMIGIYGLGRFGAYWAEQLARFFDVSAWSRNPDRPTPPGVERVSENDVLSSDVLILCVEIAAMEEVIVKIAPRLKPGMLVMDTCSVKVHPAKLMRNLLPETVQVLATHPMFGPDSGKEGLENLPLVYSPLRMSGEQDEKWEKNFQSMGLHVVRMSPEEHDIEAAYTQGVTHFIGRILGELYLKPSPIATTGYQDLLEIVDQTCNDPWKLFVDLQHYNPYTSGMRVQLYRVISDMLKQFDSIGEL